MIALLEGDERRGRKAVNELVNYGLLERRGDRLHIGHALIHEYAARHLPLSKEALERVAAYYIEWCGEQSAAGVPGYARLDDERAHCLRLIRACLDGELWQEVKGLVGAINIYLERQGWWIEKMSALDMNLIAARHAEDRRDEAWCLNELGYTYRLSGDNEKALAYYEQSLFIRRELGDRKGEGETLNNMAVIYRRQCEYGQALQTYQQSLSIKCEIGDRKGEGTVLNNIGILYHDQGNYDQALSYYEQSLPIHREVDNKYMEGITLSNIASIYYAQGDYSKAVDYSQQALAIHHELGDRAREAVTCWNLGTDYEQLGDLARAEEYMTLAVEIAEKIGHPLLEKYRDGLEQVRAKRRAG